MTPDPETVRVWEDRAEAYDRLCHRWEIFTLLSSRLIDMLPADLEGPVLDLGAGSGLTTELLLARHPRCNSILLDPAAAMIEIARRNLAGRAADFHVASIEAAPALGIRAAAAVSSASMQFLEFEPAFAALERIIEPRGRFVFNLWNHHWEETAASNGMAEWHAIARAVCDAAGVAGLPEPVPPKNPPKTRRDLMSTSGRHGFQRVEEHRDEDHAPVARGIDFMAMTSDWPVKGLSPELRESLLQAMFDRAAGSNEPVVSTRFAFERIA